MRGLVTGHIITIQCKANHLGISGEASRSHVSVTLSKVGCCHEVLWLELHHPSSGVCVRIVLNILINIHIYGQSK